MIYPVQVGLSGSLVFFSYILVPHMDIYYVYMSSDGPHKRDSPF